MRYVQSFIEPCAVSLPIRFRFLAPGGVQPLVELWGPCAVMPHGLQSRRLRLVELLDLAKVTNKGENNKSAKGSAWQCKSKGLGRTLWVFLCPFGLQRSTEALP